MKFSPFGAKNTNTGELNNKYSVMEANFFDLEDIYLHRQANGL